MAMLREQGELALARGDRAGAEAAWSQMLKLVVEPTDRTVKKPAQADEPGRRCGFPCIRPLLGACCLVVVVVVSHRLVSQGRDR